MAGVRRCLELLFILLVLFPSSAAAHSSSVETNPRDGATLETLPAEATVTFDERPQTADVVVASPDRKVHTLKARIVGTTIQARLPTHGPRGTYELSYRVVSADGHPVSGSIDFTVTTGPDASTHEAPEQPTEPADGSLAPLVIGFTVLGVAASVLVARSLRR